MACVRKHKPWERLDRAHRAADQVLQPGGFHVVVLDLASVAPHEALRIPSATWFRYRRAAEENDAILLLLTRETCARSSAACVLECSGSESPKIYRWADRSFTHRVGRMSADRTGTPNACGLQ